MDSRRREERIAARLSVRVWGMDANGKPFSETSNTLDITRNGARLSGLQCPLKQDEIIAIQHAKEKARFRVAWVGPPGTARSGQIGVVCIEPTKYIWGKPLNEFKPARQLGARVPSGFFVGSEPAAKAKEDERRDSTRYVCTGGAEFKNVESGFTNWGTLTDVSEAGCYIETMHPLPVRTLLDLHLHARNLDILSRAVVRSSDPNVGMGIEFIQLSPEDKQRLTSLISTLSIIPGSASRAPAPAPNLTIPAPPPVTRTLGPVPSRAAEPSASDLLRSASQQLRDAAAAIESNTSPLDPQALAEFLFAMDHARETAFDKQNWLRNGAPVADPKLLAELTPALLRTLTTLAREFTVQLESGNLDAEAIKKLRSTIAELHDRLAGLTRPAPLPPS
jgi:PilZ domain